MSNNEINEYQASIYPIGEWLRVYQYNCVRLLSVERGGALTANRY